MCIRVVQGKGGKDRYVPLGADVLELLRAWWHIAHPSQWLFARRATTRRSRCDAQSAQRWYRAACADAGITKRGGIHTLRHCYATHLLEAGVDLYSLSQWLGHRHVSTTTRYLHLARPDAPDGATARSAEAAGGAAAGRRPLIAVATTLAEVLQHFGPEYLRTHDLSTAQARAWRAIVACRTTALGGQRMRCDGCGRTAVALALVPQPALPAVPEPPTRCLARCTAGRVARRAVLPPGLHAAA